MIRTMVLSAALLLAVAAPVEASHWRGPIRLPWYGPGFYGNRTACGQVLTQRIVGVATNLNLRCGTKIELRWNGRRVTVPVIDRMADHPSLKFDASPRVACYKLNPRRLKGTCFTRDNVSWRVVS